MACTGVPEVRDDHAVLMVKFARACLTRMSQLLPTLQESLLGGDDDDTVHLSMRVGIHSGPVTAGVLRGERSRFQLFGDTVVRACCDTKDHGILFPGMSILDACLTMLIVTVAEHGESYGVERPTGTHPCLSIDR